MKTRNTLILALATAGIMSAAGCSYYEGFHYKKNGSGGVYNEEPNRTAPGKEAFDHAHATLNNLCLVISDILTFNEYYTGDEETKMMMRDNVYYGAEITGDEENGRYKILRSNRMQLECAIKDSLGLTEEGAEWKITHRLPGVRTYDNTIQRTDLYFTANYAGENKIRITLPFYREISNNFNGKFDFMVGYGRASKANQGYDLTISGTETLQSKQESWFVIDLVTQDDLRAFYYPEKGSYRLYYITGIMDIDVKNLRTNSTREVHAEIGLGGSAVDITYEGYKERWEL